MPEARHWRWVLGRKLKGVPVERTFEERYRTQALTGPGQLRVGPWTHWIPPCQFQTWTPEDSIEIGAFTSIASGTVLLCGGVHHVDHLATYTMCLFTGEPVAAERLTPGRITIGSDVWIATQAMILSPVTLGHGAVVAARSVVTQDVPPYAIVAGSPARIMRYRFDPETIEVLLALRWWDWPDDAVKDCVSLLRGGDVEALSAYATQHGLQA